MVQLLYYCELDLIIQKYAKSRAVLFLHIVTLLGTPCTQSVLQVQKAREAEEKAVKAPKHVFCEQPPGSGKAGGMFD